MVRDKIKDFFCYYFGFVVVFCDILDKYYVVLVRELYILNGRYVYMVIFL